LLFSLLLLSLLLLLLLPLQLEKDVAAYNKDNPDAPVLPVLTALVQDERKLAKGPTVIVGKNGAENDLPPAVQFPCSLSSETFEVSTGVWC
jgi:hypothetical protein